MVLITDLISDNEELRRAWIVATGGTKKVPTQLLLNTDIIKLCRDIIRMIVSKSLKKHLRINAILTNGTVKIFHAQVNNVYNIVIATQSSEQFSLGSQELLSRATFKKPKYVIPPYDETEEILPDISIEEILQSSVNVADITDITIREPILPQLEEIDIGSIGFGPEMLEEPIIPIEISQLSHPPIKKIKLFEEEILIRAPTIAESSIREIPSIPTISPQRQITPTSSIPEPSAEPSPAQVRIPLQQQLEPPKRYLIKLTTQKKVYINMNQEEILGNMLTISHDFQIPIDMEDDLDIPETYVTIPLDRIPTTPPSRELSQMEVRGREQDELSIRTSLEIDREGRRLSKTPSPKVPWLTDVEINLPSPKFPRIETEPAPEISARRLSESFSSSININDRQNLLEFINNWNYDENDLRINDICGLNCTRKQVARKFNHLLYLAKEQLIILTNKQSTLELDRIMKK